MIRDVVRLPTKSKGLVLYGRAEVPEFVAPLGRNVQIPRDLYPYKLIEEGSKGLYERYVVCDREWDPNTWKDVAGDRAVVYPIALKLLNTTSPLSKIFLFVGSIKQMMLDYGISKETNIISIGQSIVNRYRIKIADKGAMKLLSRITPLLPDYWPDFSLERKADRDLYYKLRNEITIEEEMELVRKLSLPIEDVDSLTRMCLDQNVLSTSDLEQFQGPSYRNAMYRGMIPYLVNETTPTHIFTHCMDSDPYVTARLLPLFIYHLCSENYAAVALVDGQKKDVSYESHLIQFEKYVDEEAKQELINLSDGRWYRLFAGVSRPTEMEIAITRDYLSHATIMVANEGKTITYRCDLVWWLLASTSLINR